MHVLIGRAFSGFADRDRALNKLEEHEEHEQGEEVAWHWKRPV
jgi:hypothetical protein